MFHTYFTKKAAAIFSKRRQIILFEESGDECLNCRMIVMCEIL